MRTDVSSFEKADRPLTPMKAWGFLLAIVAFVVAMGLLKRPLGIFLILAFCGVCATFEIAQLIWKGMIVPSTLGIRCPKCDESGLALVSVVSFGPRYYRCAACGQRCRRDGPSEPWELADGPEDADYYDPKRRGPAIRNNSRRSLGLFILSLVLGAACVALGVRFAPIVGVVLGFVCYLIVSRASDRLRHPRLAERAGVFDRDLDQR